jgi:hypothetical protein
MLCRGIVFGIVLLAASTAYAEDKLSPEEQALCLW